MGGREDSEGWILYFVCRANIGPDGNGLGLFGSDAPMKKNTIRREDYLKLIYKLSGTREVRGVDLARELEVSRPTVCIYLKQLAEAGDTVMDVRHTVYLTEQGRIVAQTHRASISFCWSCCKAWECPAPLPRRMPVPGNTISARRATKP